MHYRALDGADADAGVRNDPVPQNDEKGIRDYEKRNHGAISAARARATGAIAANEMSFQKPSV